LNFEYLQNKKLFSQYIVKIVQPTKHNLYLKRKNNVFKKLFSLLEMNFLSSSNYNDNIILTVQIYNLQ